MRKATGYSLVELVVVIGIMGIIFATGVASYNRMNTKNQVEMEANKVVSALRNWQKEADSGIGANDCNGVFGGVRVALGQGEITGSVLCDGVGGGVEIHKIADGVTPVSPDGSPVGFDLLPNGKGVSVESRIRLSKAGYSYLVTIRQSGSISVEKEEVDE